MFGVAVWRRRLAGLVAAAMLLATVAVMPPAAAQESGDGGGDFRADVDYILLDPPQPVRTPAGKIEVIEFFNYSCPHCFRFQRPLVQWAEDFDLSDVQITHQPVVFTRFNGLFARAHYAMVALGIHKEFAPKLYNAIHIKKKLLNSPGRFLDWLEDEGIERDRAAAAFESFTVNLNTERARTIPATYGVESTPHFAVAGKYLLSPAYSGTPERLIKVLSYLIEQERAQQ